LKHTFLENDLIFKIRIKKIKRKEVSELEEKIFILKTKFLNDILSNFKDHSFQYNLAIAELNLIWFLTPLKAKRKLIQHIEKLYNEYKIVVKEEKNLADAGIRFYICFLKYHKYSFEQIKEIILRGHKERKKLKKVIELPESWSSYINRIEDMYYEMCEDHRKSLNLPIDIDLESIECENAPCREGCPFESKTKIKE